MSQVYYCELCDQKYIETYHTYSKKFYFETIPKTDKRELKYKKCRTCSKLFGDRYGTVTLRMKE